MAMSSLHDPFVSAQSTRPAADAAAPRRTTTVVGYLWTADNAPISNATLRLRNVISGKVERSATSNDEGQFTFSDIEGGAYLVEYVERESVLAVGSVFTIVPGETVATFVRLAPDRRMVGLFMRVGSTAVAAAASLGITAIATPRPNSGSRPISPNR
jgi:Carboxypeptidase regulatory-like domain